MDTLFRRLIILQGDNNVIIKQLDYLINSVAGDWLTIGDVPILVSNTIQHYVPTQAKLLLGREFKHAIFDARQGFNLDAFAILTGTLIAESLLILLLPEDFTHWQDQDSLRWSELPQSLDVPNFVTHLNTVILQQKSHYIDSLYCLTVNKQHRDDYLTNIISKYRLLAKDHSKFYHYQEQQNLLNHLITLDDKIVLITAKRGRGKSALAGMFAKQHNCIVTAANKNSVTTLLRFAPKDTPFFAPDELIKQLQKPFIKSDWLIIDEAAMIPLPIIATLIDHFEHVLLTTTTDGYEGTGQGLLLKLLDQYQHHSSVSSFNLFSPIRWPEGDPLEFFIDNLTITNWPEPTIDLTRNHLDVKKIVQSELVQSGTKLSHFFGLLKAAHYRTTLVDLRRLLDARNIELYSGELGDNNSVGVLIAIKEGGLDDALIEQILKGYRRPKGNLVAQSLVAHGGEPYAARLSSIRINRIAVYDAMRKQGVATAMLSHLIANAKLSGNDFISVSFAYSPEMYHFWSKCGFTAVHIGTHKEASSGSYAVMAIYPISQAGMNLCNILQHKLARNWYWLKSTIDIDLPIMIDSDQAVNDQDKLELWLFATTSYSYSASFAVLYRLANWVKTERARLIMMLPLLLSLTNNQFCQSIVIAEFNLSGKNELLMLLRQEVYQFMIAQGFVNE